MVFRAVTAAIIIARHAHARLAVVGHGQDVKCLRGVATIFGGVNFRAGAAGQHQAQPAVVRGGAQLRVLVGVIQVIRLAGDDHLDQRILKILRQRKGFGDAGNAGDRRQFGRQHKLRFKTGRRQQRVE